MLLLLLPEFQSQGELSLPAYVVLAIGWWKNPGVVILTSSNKAEYFLEIALLLGGN